MKCAEDTKRAFKTCVQSKAHQVGEDDILLTDQRKEKKEK